MSCILCRKREQNAPRTALIQQFVDCVNLLWEEVHTAVESRHWKIVSTLNLQILPSEPIWNCETEERKDEGPSILGCSDNENSNGSLRCTVQDVKDFELFEPPIPETLALLCTSITSQEIFRVLVRRDSVKVSAKSWTWGDWESLKRHELIIDAYAIKWREEGKQGKLNMNAGAIIQAERCRVVSPRQSGRSLSTNRSKAVLSSPPPTESQRPVECKVPHYQEDLVVCAVPPHEERRRKSISDLLAPIGCTPGPTQSSVESDISEALENTPSPVEASLGKGLDESSSAHHVSRPSISTPLPLVSRTLASAKFPGAQLLSRAQRFSGKPIEVDDSPPKVALPILYRQVQRNKRAREQLPAFDCELCRDWHEGMEKCFPQVASDVTRSGMCQCNAKKRPSMGMVSRHRFMTAPSSTPSGYWDVRFPPTQMPPPTQNDA